MAEQRYPAVLAVIAEGRPVCSVARQWGVSRQTLHAWLGRYEAWATRGTPPGAASIPRSWRLLRRASRGVRDSDVPAEARGASPLVSEHTLHALAMKHFAGPQTIPAERRVSGVPVTEVT